MLSKHNRGFTKYQRMQQALANINYVIENTLKDAKDRVAYAELAYAKNEGDHEKQALIFAYQQLTNAVALWGICKQFEV